MPTVRDVARVAAVSVATVSAVVNKNKFVSPELVHRVEAAIVELGYRPNLVARSLKSGRTRTLGVIIPNIRDPYWAEVVAAIEGVVRAEGYTLLLFHTGEDPQVEERSLQILAEMKADGIVLVPTGGDGRSRIAPVLSDGIPIVLLSRKVEGLSLDAVVTDYSTAGYIGTRHLLSMGYHRVALLAYPSFASSGADKLDGYERALVEAGQSTDASLIRSGRLPLEESSFREMDHLMTLSEGPPDAILVSSHLLVIGAYRYLRDKGLRIPEDMAIVGFDEYPWTPLMHPALTVVQQSRNDIGLTVAHRLLARIRGEVRGPGETISMPASLIVRESCGWPLRGTTREPLGVVPLSG